MCNLKSKAKCKLPKIKITRHTFHNKNQSKTSGIKKNPSLFKSMVLVSVGNKKTRGLNTLLLQTAVTK